MQYSQKNIECLFRVIGSLPSNEFTSGDHFDLIRTRNSVWPNQLLNLRVDEMNIGNVLDDIEQRAVTGEIPDLLMLNPTTDKPYLLPALRGRSYRSSSWTAMSHDLKHLPDTIEDSDLQIIVIEDQQKLKSWLVVIEQELMGGLALNPGIFSALLDNQDCVLFLGFVSGTPVATSMLFIRDDQAGIYLVATAKEHRRKGYGKALTLASLQKAKEHSCSHVDIQATAAGKGVYTSLGFVDQGDIHVFRIKIGRDT